MKMNKWLHKIFSPSCHCLRERKIGETPFENKGFKSSRVAKSVRRQNEIRHPYSPSEARRKFTYFIIYILYNTNICTFFPVFLPPVLYLFFSLSSVFGHWFFFFCFLFLLFKRQPINFMISHFCYCCDIYNEISFIKGSAYFP